MGSISGGPNEEDKAHPQGPSGCTDPFEMSPQWAELIGMEEKSCLSGKSCSFHQPWQRFVHREQTSNKQGWHRTCQQSGESSHPLSPCAEDTQMAPAAEAQSTSKYASFLHVPNCPSAKALMPGKQRRHRQGTGVLHGLMNLAMIQ